MPLSEFDGRKIEVINYPLMDPATYQIDIKIKEGDCPKGYSLERNGGSISECIGDCQGSFFSAFSSAPIPFVFSFGTLFNQERVWRTRVSHDFKEQFDLNSTVDFYSRLRGLGYRTEHGDIDSFLRHIMAQYPVGKSEFKHDFTMNEQVLGTISNYCVYIAIQDTILLIQRQNEIQLIQFNLENLLGNARVADKEDYPKMGHYVIGLEIQ